MSRRRGQRGSVRVVGEKYIGRYWADVPGSSKRARKAVEIGSIHEMTRSEAKRWLANYIEERGINSAAHLARSQSLVATFGEAAELWWQRQLIGLWLSHPRTAAWAVNCGSCTAPSERQAD